MNQDASQLSFIVVEDNEFQRKVLVKTLEAMGSPLVLEAGEGQEAIEKLVASGQTIDIAISDLDMPGMDGVEFIRHLSEQKLCGAVAIASGMDKNLVHTVENLVVQHGLSVLGHLEKPVNREKVQRIINAFNQKERILNPDTHLNDITPERIEEALESGQIEVWYQPKAQIKDRKWCAVEALSRWNHPQMGIIMPDRYIPQIEAAGSVDKLTWNQLHQIMKQLQVWRKEGKTLTVSLNISPIMLEDITLPEKLNEIIRFYKIPAELLVLEITESVVIQNITKSLESIARLKLKGFSLSIDDFGTGYSSLRQLSRIPFSELKIDQSFVKDADRNPTRKAIVEANIHLAKKLGLKTVAEGVETEEEWQFLASLGCDMAQGFYVAKAMPCDALDSWFQQWRAC